MLSLQIFNEIEISTKQARDNYLAGIFNGSERYKGTFANRISAVYTPSITAYSEYVQSITSVMTIDKAVDNRVQASILDWCQTPAVNYIIDAVIFIGSVAVSVATGGAGAAVGVIIKEVVITAAKKLITKIIIDGASYVFSGRTIIEHIGNLNFKYTVDKDAWR